MYHIFIIRSSVDRHLGCFHFLVFLKIEHQWPWLRRHLCNRIQSFGYMPKGGIAGSYGRAVSSLLKNLTLMSIMVAPVFTPNSNKCFSFSISPPVFVIMWGVCVCVCMCVCRAKSMCHDAHVEIWRPLTEITSSCQSCESQAWTNIVRLGSKHLLPICHLVCSTL